MEKIFFDKKTIFLFVALILLMILLLSLGAHDTLDARFYYSADQARSLFDSFSAADREAYFKTEIADLFFILTYTILFIVGFGKIFPRNLFFLYLAIIPGLCDLIETSVILYTLKHTEPLYAFDWLGIFTFVKWGVAIPVAIFLIVMSYRKFGPKKKALEA